MCSNRNNKTILVTGAAGMIGAAVVQGLLKNGHFVIGVDVKDSEVNALNYLHFILDLMDNTTLLQLIKGHSVDRVIHLAALAHHNEKKKPSWDDYYFANVECSRSVFKASQDVPVLFISTVDVYGFKSHPVNENSGCCPVSNYGKTKFLAEEECKKLNQYTIFRLAPVYTDAIKRDIQKRYYLKYPTVAYQIGKGAEYEVASIFLIVNHIVNWCEAPQNENRIYLIKDEQCLKTKEAIKREKEKGRAKFVLYVPRWIVITGFWLLKGIFGSTHLTFLLSKVVYPLRTE